VIVLLCLKVLFLQSVVSCYLAYIHNFRVIFVHFYTLNVVNLVFYMQYKILYTHSNFLITNKKENTGKDGRYLASNNPF